MPVPSLCLRERCSAKVRTAAILLVRSLPLAHRFFIALALCVSATAVVQAQTPPALTDEVSIGRPDAPVTVVEYLSLNCPHCKTYHQTVFPEINETMVASGRVRYVFREMPLDEQGMAAAMLARCVPRERYVSAIGLIYSESEEWSTTNKPLAALKALAFRLGLDGPAFEKCIKNKELNASLREARRAAMKDGITATPTFVIGGRRHVGATTFKDIERLVGTGPR